MDHRKVTFIESIALFFKNYAQFKGRSSRSAYWWWALASFLIGLILEGVDYLLLDATFSVDGDGPLSLAFSLVTFIPNFAISFRRLQDVGRSGYWIFLVFTLIGIIPILYWSLKRGTKGENRFGADIEAGKTGDLSPFEEINTHNNQI